jgi:hypothetical protein
MVAEVGVILTAGVTVPLTEMITAFEVTGVVEAQAALEVIRTVIDEPLVKVVEE